MKRLVVFAVSVILIVSCLAGSITTKADTSATTKQWPFETGIRGFNTEPSTPSAGNKMFYYLHVLIFKRKLHEELTARAARHSASAALGGASRNAIILFTTVCPLSAYIRSAATLSAHKFITPLQLSIQKPVKISPLSLSNAHTTRWA